MIDPQLDDDAPPAVSSAVLWQFAALWTLVFGSLAGWEAFGRGRGTPAIVYGAISVLGGLPGLVRPQSVALLFRFLSAVARPIGWLVSEVLVACLFYLVLTPLGLFFRLIGRDPLVRRRRTGQDSYWSPKPKPSGIDSYFRGS